MIEDPCVMCRTWPTSNNEDKGTFGRAPARCRKDGAGAGGADFCGSACITFSQAKPFPRLLKRLGRAAPPPRAFGRTLAGAVEGARAGALPKKP